MQQSESSPDRTTRFLARVDAELEALPSDRERLDFLAKQLAGWQHRMGLFVRTAGESEPIGNNGDDPPQLSDFLMTICALGGRRSLILARAEAA